MNNVILNRQQMETFIMFITAPTTHTHTHMHTHPTTQHYIPDVNLQTKMITVRNFMIQAQNDNRQYNTLFLI